MSAYELLAAYFAPYFVDDDGSLATLLAAFCSGAEMVDDAVREEGDAPAYARLLDPTTCPAWALPWLGQLYGVIVPPGLDEGAMRAMVAPPAGRRRGTVDAMKKAVAPTLTSRDPRNVLVLERTTDGHHFTVATYSDDTPDTAATLAAAKTQKPAGLVMSVVQIARNTYLSRETQYATYSDAETALATYALAEVNT